MAQKGRSICVACNSYYSLEECCCHERAQELPSYMPGKVLKVCAKGVCTFGVASAYDEEWTYSFEAERVSCSRKQVQHALGGCNGITGKAALSLATSLPHASKDPNNALKYI